MAGELKNSLISYVNLLGDERAKLEAKESQLATLLLTDLGIKGDCYWIATQDSLHRTIRLMIPGDPPRMVFEASEIELAELSSSELFESVKHAVRRA